MEGARHILGIVVAAAALAACGDAEPAGGAEDELVKAPKLDVLRRAALPIPEVSGLGSRTLGSKTQYLAIGDADAKIVTFDVRDGVASNVKSHDVSPLFGRGAPQWEAVAGDSTGAVFLLGEATDRISVLDAKLEKITHEIDLSIAADHPLAKDWKRDANSRGEGMVLLANGHVLVLKEKAPVALVEFAPKGEAAEGFRADLVLGSRAFPLPSAAKSKLHATHHWLLKSADVGVISDASELAVEADGRLLLLSDQGRAVVRVERTLRPDEDKIDVKAIFRLPSSVQKPEGLVIAAGAPLVASDEKTPGETLFTMSPLP
ncbi:MAG: SdiA-regulated domain-containing protein [Labilithrix sp.]|nr:SdiA-regulated domain-containing protein [Labilithrix sp.]